MLKIRVIFYKSAVVSEGIIVNHQMPIFKVYFDILISDPAQRSVLYAKDIEEVNKLIQHFDALITWF